MVLGLDRRSRPGPPAASAGAARATVVVGDDDRALLRQHRRQQRAGAREQALADHDVVAGRWTAPPAGGAAAARPRARRSTRPVVTSGAVVAAVHDDVGLRIDGVALRHQRWPGSRPGRRRPAAAGGARRRRGAPARRQRGSAARPRRPRADRGAGGGSMKAPPPVASTIGSAGQQAPDHPALAVAELRLAVAGEQSGDGAAGGQFDLGVGVAERQPEAGRESPADATFCRRPSGPTRTMLRPECSARRAESGLSTGAAVLRVMAADASTRAGRPGQASRLQAKPRLRGAKAPECVDIFLIVVALGLLVAARRRCCAGRLPADAACPAHQQGAAQRPLSARH